MTLGRVAKCETNAKTLVASGRGLLLPANQSSYSKEMFGEFVQSVNSPNIFSRQYSVLPGGGKPLPVVTGLCAYLATAPFQKEKIKGLSNVNQGRSLWGSSVFTNAVRDRGTCGRFP